jgi:hypothetical protein
MVITMLVPAASAAAAVISLFAPPRGSVRIVGASLVTVLAVTAFLFSWSLGTEAVNSAKFWAENVDEIRRNLPY